MNRDQERTSRVQQRRATSDDHSIYKQDTASQTSESPTRRRRSQAARMQTQPEDMREYSPYERESQYAQQRSGKSRTQLPERPRMRQFAEEDEDIRTDRYQQDEVDFHRPNSKGAAVPARNTYRKAQNARMIDLEDDYEDDEDFEPVKKRKPTKWIILSFVILLLVAGGVYLTLNRDVVEPFVAKVFELINGPAPTVEPTPEPTAAPTEIPKTPLEMAIVSQFSVSQEGEIEANSAIIFTIQTSMLTDRIRIVDANDQELIQLSGEDMYQDLEDGRTWTAMYTFESAYEGVVEVHPGNESGWNEANGSQLDIVVIDPEASNPEQATTTNDYTVQKSTIPVSPAPLTETVLVKNEPTTGFSRANPVQMGLSAEYAGENGLKGVLTFRGDNLRQNAAYGSISPASKTLESTWMVNVGVPGDGGYMWNVQPLIIQWHSNTREKMQLVGDKATKKELKEVVFASNDSKIYFIDLEDGSVTREKMSFKTPLSMLTTPSVYPSGMPMMFTGTGNPVYLAEDTETTGMFLYNFMDSSDMGLIRGSNEKALSTDATFITSPLIDRNTSTMFVVGGNGILYATTLNVDADRETLVPKIVSPTTEMYITQPSDNLGADATVYSSLAAYGDIAYYATQGGILQAVNVNTLTTVWALNLGQETDAAISLDVDALGNVTLYAASRPDANGMSHVRCIDGLTGIVSWDVEISGAISASMLIGANNLSNMVYVAAEETSVLYALRKDTGDLSWTYPLKASKTSAPIALYDDEGAGYIVQGDEGSVYLLEGLTGAELSSLVLEGTVVGSPAAFNDMITLTTSAGKLYGIKVN